MSGDAARFHGENIEAFLRQYESDPDFQERLTVWRELTSSLIEKGTRVLDLGCGNGVMSFEWAQKGAEVVGVDGSEEMILRCEARKAGAPELDIRFHRMELPADVPNAPFDVVAASSLVEYLDDSVATDAWLASLVTPGGWLVFSLPNRQSLYRKMETMRWKLTRRPAYRALVRRSATVAETIERFNGLGFQLLQFRYFAHRPLLCRALRGVASPRRTENLFAVVFRKPR